MSVIPTNFNQHENNWLTSRIDATTSNGEFNSETEKRDMQSATFLDHLLIRIWENDYSPRSFDLISGWRDFDLTKKGIEELLESSKNPTVQSIETYKRVSEKFKDVDIEQLFTGKATFTL